MVRVARGRLGSYGARMSDWPKAFSALVLGITPLLFGCEDGSDGDESSEDTSSAEPVARCELVSMVELAGADAEAPNGRAGSEILEAIPQSFQTTLHWDLSKSTVEVEVEGVSGQSSMLDLTFTLPASPAFSFEDWEAVYPDGGPAVELICDDYVRTTVDVTAETQDGALVLSMVDLVVRLGTDDPAAGTFAKPFILDTGPRASPTVIFTVPVSQPADGENTFALSFDDPDVTGAITAYATDADETYRMVVARW